MRKAAWIFTPALVLGLAGCAGGEGRDTDATGTTTTMSTTTTGTTAEMTTTGTAGSTTAEPTTGAPTTSTTDVTTGTTTGTTGTTTGGGALTCEEYCGVYAASCADFSEYDNPQACLDQCSQWPEGVLNDTSGDSLGCRLYHATVAGMGDANLHCPHAGPNGAGVCIAVGAPVCADYCTKYLANCKDALNAYVDEADCLAQCGGWYPGTTADTAGDTVGCRDYHAMAAAGDPALHCPHAGPGGGGVCVVQ